MPTYDVGSDPPAPVASVTLRHPEREAQVSGVPLLIDTGADVSLLPRAAVERLGIGVEAGRRYELIGFDGSRSFAQVVVLDVIFSRRAFRGPYLLTDDARGLLGRDVLNHVALLLDGPRQQWSEYSG